MTMNVYHYEFWTTYRSHYTSYAEFIHDTHAALELAEEAEGIKGAAAIILAAEIAAIIKEEIEEQRNAETWTIKRSYNAYDFPGDITWTQGKPYYHDGESVKIGSATCKSKRVLYKIDTTTLVASFPTISIDVPIGSVSYGAGR